MGEHPMDRNASWMSSLRSQRTRSLRNWCNMPGFARQPTGIRPACGRLSLTHHSSQFHPARSERVELTVRVSCKDQRVPNHISKTVRPTVKIGPPSWIRTASNREPCHTRYSLSRSLPKVEAFGHSVIPFAEMALGFGRPGVRSAGARAGERPAPPEYLQSRFPELSPLAAMRPTQ